MEGEELLSVSESTQSQEEGTPGTLTKRWNLRRRPPPQPDEDRSLQERETAVTSKVSHSPATTTTTSSGGKKRKATEQKGPSPKRKVQKPGRQLQKTNGEQLFEIIMSGKGALQSVASEWVDRYEKDAESAMVELIQFVVLCCGCKAPITMVMFQEDDTHDIIRSLTENFAEESGEYPLIMTGPTYKKFKANFVEFIERVVDQCQHSILYDEYMLDMMLVWLVGLTDSQVRAFRHTCTLACVKLLTALMSVANNVVSELDNTQRQIDAERRRQQVNKVASAKLEKLLTKKAGLQRSKNELEGTMRKIFSSVFVHRYRDVRPEIRALCISELGTWMMEYSAYFLADSYLKYVGWTLFDKVGEVRLASLQVLESLYDSEDTAPHLELFTEKFKERLLSMRLDREDNVAVHAIHVCGHLLSLDMLEPEDCVQVCELVFVENRAVSHAAGVFAVRYLFSEDFMARAKQAKVPKGRKQPTDGQIMLRELVRFFLDVKIHEHATYFVDSLWDYTDVLKDWEVQVSLLLDEKCGILLTDEEEGVVIEVMACAVRRATTASLPPGRSRGRVLSNREKRAMEEAKEGLSGTLMVALPELISKFGSDAGRAVNLAHIPQHFDLELYSEHRLQKHLESLLAHLHQLTLKHLEPSVLDECAQTYCCLLDAEFSLHSTAELSFNQLVDELVESFKQYLTDCKDQSLVEEEDEDCFGLVVALRRLTAFYKMLDVSGWKISKELTDLLANGVAGQCSEKILTSVIVCLRMEILWAMHSLNETNPDRESMRQIRSKLLHLVDQCQELVKFGSGRGQREAFVTLCDLLVVFARQLRREGQLASLVYVPAEQLQQAMQDYVLEYVLCEEEEEEEEEGGDMEAQAERLNDRRVLLAGFLKLAMFSVIDMKMAAPVFGQYLKQYHNFGDLIKAALSRCREANPMMWYKTVLLCLQQMFLAHREECGGQVDQTSPDWTDLKDLARRFGLSFGFDSVKARQPLVGIHRDGIVFALSRPDGDGDPLTPPPNLDFLLVLSEFSPRLLEVDRIGKKGVAVYLQGQLEEKVEGRVEWDALRVYQGTLEAREKDTADLSHGGRGKGKQSTTATTKGRKRGMRAPSHGDDNNGWLTARQSKVPRVESPSTVDGSEEGTSDRERGTPPDILSWTSKGRKTKSRTRST